MSNSLILAVDTSSPHASFAIIRDGKTLASLSSKAYIPHSRTFFVNISTLLNLANLEIKEIDAFAVATGPGSFTGLRVGLAAVKGLAYTLGKPAIGINSIDCHAVAAGVSGQVLVMLDAGRGEVYCGLREIDSDGLISKAEIDFVGTPDSVIAKLAGKLNDDSLVIVGDGAQKYRSDLEYLAISLGTQAQTVSHLNLNLKSWQIKVDDREVAIVLGCYANKLLLEGDHLEGDHEEIHAYYIRPSDAEIKREKGL